MSASVAPPANASRARWAPFGQRALVVVQGRLHDAARDQAGECERLLAARLRVADPELDGPERVMRAHAPPELRRLDDRARGGQPIDEAGVALPASERLV